MNREQERRLDQIRLSLKKDSLEKLIRKKKITEVVLKLVNEEIESKSREKGNL